ncbi:MAG: 30S ribosomal protein S6 [Candidatus Moraniibacteriota bacterium]
MRYELFYLVGVSKELDLDKIKADVDEIVTSHSGVFEEKATQEKRKMAYKIKKDTHGIYIAKRFSLEDPATVPEIITKLNIHPGVLRFIISDASGLPELKTKEERIEQEEKRGEVEKMRQEKKEAEELEKNPPKKEEVVVAPKTEAEKTQKAEDAQALDKKLEEILNI